MMNVSIPTPAEAYEPGSYPVHQFSLTDLAFGFMPAFQDPLTGETHLSVYRDGHVAVVHLFDGVPEHWIDERDERGRAVSLKDGIVAGFIRNAAFFTPGDLAEMQLDA